MNVHLVSMTKKMNGAVVTVTTTGSSVTASLASDPNGQHRGDPTGSTVTTSQNGNPFVVTITDLKPGDYILTITGGERSLDLPIHH